MPELLYLTNFPDANIVEQSQLNAAVAATGTSVALKNVSNFAIGDVAVIGRLATEQAEKRELSAVDTSAQTVTFSALSFAHKKLDPITKLRGDQIRIYRAANVDDTQPDDDDFILIHTINIDVTNQITIWNDPTGGVGYWYKITYYASNGGAETDIADSMAVRGGNYGHYATVEQVRKSSGLVGNSDVEDETIAEARNEAESVIKGSILAAGYTLPFEEPYPPSVVRLVKQLASAYLLQEEFGASVQGSNRDGFELEKSIMAKLKLIQEGKIQLIDVNKETVEDKISDVGGSPDDSSESQSGGDPLFTMGKQW